MKERHFDTVSQTEALLNELKGNLFEYLVAQELAKVHNVEGSFLRSFTGEVKDQFIQYENWIRTHASYLLRRLPPLARQCALELGQVKKLQLKNIYVVGKKLSEASGFRGQHEGDLLLQSNDDKLTPVSLKLCKSNAFVNTKSGGVRSFVIKYFGQFEQAQELQKELNLCVDESFHWMGHKLYDLAGLNFEGSFDQQWRDAGYSDLPGQLNTEQREIVLQSYQKVVKKMYELLYKMYECDCAKFNICLQALLGFAGESLQMICFYRDNLLEEDGQKAYAFDRAVITDSEKIKSESFTANFGQLRAGLSSFEIDFPDRILQLRIKPMNRFTASAHKVNCSVKMKSLV